MALIPGGLSWLFSEELVMRLENKTASVTGRGWGIAQVIVFGMAWEDAKITVVGRTKSKLEETSERIRSQGKNEVFIVADVSNSIDVKAMVLRFIKENGKIDILVNNAALLSKPEFVENTTEEK